MDEEAAIFHLFRMNLVAERFGFDDRGENAGDGNEAAVLREQIAQGMFGNGSVAVKVHDEALMMADFKVDAGQVVTCFLENVRVVGDFAEGVGEIFVILSMEAGGDLLEFAAGGLELAGGELNCFAGFSEMPWGLFDDLGDVGGFLAERLEFLEHGFHFFSSGGFCWASAMTW